MPWRLMLWNALAILLWMQGEVTCEGLFFSDSVKNTCIFYYWQVDWHTAIRTCEEQNTTLLCYKSKKEIDDITAAFKLAAISSAKLAIWLSNGNCNKSEGLRECLSLHIQKEDDTVWHYFQNSCDDTYPFVCCINSSAETTTSIEYITSDSFSTTSNSLSTNTHIRTPFCPKVSNRGIDWPKTEAGKTVVRSCPGNYTGDARWLCGNTGRWQRRGPDLSGCRSQDIQDLKQRFNSTSASNMISELELLFNVHEKEVFGDDLGDILHLMTALPDRLFSELESMTSCEKWKATNDSIYKVTSVVDHFVELEDTWDDIDEEEKSVMGTDLLTTMDAMGSLMANSMPKDVKEETVWGKNMALQVMKPNFGESVTLPQWIVTSSYSHRGSVVLEEGYDVGLAKDRGNISLVFTLYKNMTGILSSSQEKRNTKGILNSAVVSTSVIQGREAVRINNQVRLQMEHIISNPNDSACVFWNMDKGEWDTLGCHLERSNETYSVCICNHLTNFALLMDYSLSISEVNQDPFHYITIIGCSLSIISLTICVIIFTCFSFHNRHSWGLRYAIHRNLCLTLLIANLILILGLDSTQNRTLCAVIAGFLHYFFLSAFSWMFLEAVHIYILLVIVFASRKSHIEKYYLFGYGFPFLIVLITALSRPTYYGRDDICWLSTEKGTIWAFMGPIAAILILNTAALTLAQYKASRISMKNDRTAIVKRWLRVTVILFPILGITWIFGFLYLGRHFIVAGYLFAIFNSFQGVCILLFHCILDKKTRNMIVDSFKKKSTSIYTGSSGIQKKSNGNIPNDVKSNSITPIEDDTNAKNTFQLPKIKSKKDWTKYRKPWSFCFELPVSEGNSKTEENNPQAVVVQWNSLPEKNCT